MEIDKSLVRLHFDRHAHEYERYADVQMQMAEHLAASAAEALRAADGGIRQVRRILEIGCGTGRLTAKLAAAFPAAHMTCIDISEQMIEVAKRNMQQLPLAADGRVSFVAVDAETIVPELAADASGRPLFDLIVSNAAFQWLNSPHSTVQSCIRLLRPGGGVLAFSTFAPGTFRQLHDSFAEAERQLGVPPAPHGQAFAGREEWSARFAEEAGTFHWRGDVVTEVCPDVRSFLHRVKRIGAGNAVAGGMRGIGGRKLLETMERIYADRYATPGGGIEADYEIGYCMFVRA